MTGKIFLVDDNSSLRKAIDSALIRMGHKVLTAKDGWECIAQIQAFKPDVVLLDIDMPGMGGLPTLEMMNQYNLIKNTKVLMLTGHNEKELVLKCLSVGAVDYLVKPFRMEDLAERIEKQLVNQSALLKTGT